MCGFLFVKKWVDMNFKSQDLAGSYLSVGVSELIFTFNHGEVQHGLKVKISSETPTER